MEYNITPDESMSGAVLEAVSEAEDTPRELLPILSEVVNPDALNELFWHGDETDSHGHLSFAYSNCIVSTDCKDYIRIKPVDGQSVVDPNTALAKSLKSAIDSEWRKSH